MNIFPNLYLKLQTSWSYQQHYQYPLYFICIELTKNGVTLLAFGNGAPDVFSSILASQKLNLYLAIGSLLGSGLFITNCVVAGVCFVGKNNELEVSKFYRDSIFLLFISFIIFIYGNIGSISIWMALVFPGVYIAYVIIVLL